MQVKAFTNGLAKIFSIFTASEPTTLAHGGRSDDQESLQTLCRALSPTPSKPAGTLGHAQRDASLGPHCESGA